MPGAQYVTEWPPCAQRCRHIDLVFVSLHAYACVPSLQALAHERLPCSSAALHRVVALPGLTRDRHSLPFLVDVKEIEPTDTADKSQ